MGCMKTSISVQFLSGGCQEQTSVVHHPMLNRNHFSRNIFLLLETEGSKHQIFNSSAEKTQRFCSNMISWHNFPVVVRHCDKKTIQQFLRLKVLQSWQISSE